MHIVPSAPELFHLVCDDGLRYGPYSSLEALVRAIRVSIVWALSDDFADPAPAALRRFMVVDHFGAVVPVAKVIAVRRRVLARKRSRRYFGAVEGQDYMFRHGPVPGIRNGKGSGRGWLRHPKTTAERRAAAGQEADRNPSLVRSRRNHRVLINSWDDIPRSAERSWKRHRKTQWR